MATHDLNPQDVVVDFGNIIVKLLKGPKLGVQPKKKQEIPLWLKTDISFVTPELLDLLKNAGIKTIAFELGSEAEHILSELNKYISVSDKGENKSD